MGQLEVLKWARENGFKGIVWICRNAAENGHLHVLKWAHEHGAAWDPECSSLAAKGGHLEALKYMHTHGCKMDYRICAIALARGHSNSRVGTRKWLSRKKEELIENLVITYTIYIVLLLCKLFEAKKALCLCFFTTI